VCSGTLAGVVPKNRNTPQDLEADLCTGAAPDLFVVNTTKGSVAFVNANVSGSLWSLTQPLPPFTLPWNGIDPAEDDTWANGDSYSIESFPMVYLASFAPIAPEYSGVVAAGGYVQHLNLAPSSVNGTTVVGNASGGVGSTVFLVEGTANRILTLNSFSAGLNFDAQQPVFTETHQSFDNTPGWKGGILRQPFQSGVTMFLEAGAIVSGTAPLLNFAGDLNDVDIEIGAIVEQTGYTLGFAYTGNAAPYVWGAGTLSVQSTGSYFIVAATATPTMLLAPGNIQLDGLATGCSQSFAAPSVINCGIPITAAAIDAPFGVAGFGGVAHNPTGATINTLSSNF
jgi:hypothetical protein